MKQVKILYTNYKGQTAVRTIEPKQIVFTKTTWHVQEQWCLEAFDVDKQAMRSFACKDIKAWWTDN